MIVAQFYCAQNPAYRPIRHFFAFTPILVSDNQHRLLSSLDAARFVQ